MLIISMIKLKVFELLYIELIRSKVILRFMFMGF